MDDQLAALIEQIVRDARLRSTREREELRRELESHFTDVDGTPQALARALERFGNPAEVSARLAQAHRPARGLTKLRRLGTALAASAGAAVVLQIAANIRVNSGAQTIALSSAFFVSIAFSALIIVALIGAWEMDIDALCGRLERRPLRGALLLAGLAALMVLTHAMHGDVLPLSTAIAASAVDVAIWTCTIAILARTDRQTAGVFTKGRP